VTALLKERKIISPAAAGKQKCKVVAFLLLFFPPHIFFWCLSFCCEEISGCADWMTETAARGR